MGASVEHHEHESLSRPTNDAGEFSDHRSSLNVTINIRRVVRTLAVVIALIFVFGSAANLVSDYVAPSKEHKLARFLSRFDITAELSIPNWYSSVSLLSAGILLITIARAKYAERDRWRFHWLALGVVFVGLSIDEMTRFHEMSNTAMSWVVTGHGLLYYPWVIPALIFCGVIGLSYIPFLLHIERRSAVLFLVAGAIYVGGAVGMDAVGGDLAEHFGTQSLYPHFSEYVEELFEDVGQLVFIYALLDYIRRHLPSIRFVVQ